MTPRRGLGGLTAILVATSLGAWLAPYPPDLQEDVAGARLRPPLARASALRTAPHRTLVVDSLARVGEAWEFERAGERGRILASELQEEPARRFYLLGTDSLGRDLASRLLHGARHSVGIAALAVLLALGLGVGVGAAAGLGGRVQDAILMRAADVLMSIPRLLVYLACAALFRPSTPLLVLVLGATTWTGLARIVRAQLLAQREGGIALAARAAGSSRARLLLLHLLPQIGPAVAVTAALRFADTLVLESALAFLGLGSPPPAVSLGSLLAAGREHLVDAWWIALWPGLLIAAIVMALRASGRSLFRAGEIPSV